MTNPHDQGHPSFTLDRRSLLQTTGLGITGSGFLATGNTARATATDSTSDGLEVTLVEDSSETEFNFPYYIYAPTEAASGTNPILIEPVNSGAGDDDFNEDLDAAERLITNRRPRTISDELGIPVVVPVIPNPASGEFFQRFTQTLDRETLEIESGDLERIDLQLLDIFEHAREYLEREDIDTETTFIMSGFSASGNFVNRFAGIHPEYVSSVTGGAINGTALLPTDEVDGVTTDYMIGVADLEALVGHEFDLHAWQSVPQLLYMGAEEMPPGDDTIPYRDVWNEEHAEKALEVYGEHMQRERMPFCEGVYAEAQAPGRIDVYDDIGHQTSAETETDSIGFHAQNIGRTWLSVTEAPSAGSTDVEVGAVCSSEDVKSDLDVVDLRVFDGSGTDLTDSNSLLRVDIYDRVRIPLARELEIGDTIEIAAVSADADNSTDAFASEKLSIATHVAFAERPGAGESSVTVEYGLDDAFEENYALLSIWTESSSWSRISLTQIQPGESGTETFELETTDPGVPFEAGDDLELWLHPPGVNRTRNNAITTSLVSVPEQTGSARILSRPLPDEETIHLEYTYAAANEELASLELSTPDETTALTSVVPGDQCKRTVAIDSDIGGVPFEPGAEIGIRLVSSDDQSIATDSTIVGPAEIEFTRQPAALDTEVSLEYSLEEDAITAEKAMIRLYTAAGSSYGTFLSWAYPGEGGRETFFVQTDEIGVPFQQGESMTVAIVMPDDPYATDPLAISTVMVNEAPDSDLGTYTDSDGIVRTEGLRDAIDDWRSDEIDTDLLRDVIDAWRSGDPVE